MAFHTKEEHKFGSKQYAYSQVWLNDEGEGKLYSHYSNCHRWDGDTYATFAVLEDGHGEPLGVVEIRAGMNAQHIKGCNEREIDKKFKVPKDKLSKVAGIDIIHKEINSRDDKKIIAIIWEFIKRIIEEMGGEADREQQGVYWAK